MACPTQTGKFFQAVEYRRQPSLQERAFNLGDVPIQNHQGEASAGIVSSEKRNRGRVMLGAGFRRGVDHGEHAVAPGGVGDRLTIVEQLVPGKEADAGPIDEFGQILLRVDQGIVAGL